MITILFGFIPISSIRLICYWIRVKIDFRFKKWFAEIQCQEQMTKFYEERNEGNAIKKAKRACCGV